MNEAAVIRYQEDDVILHQGDRSRNLYKVLEGTVALYINYDEPDEYLVGLLTFPGCFGEMTILADQPSYYTVVALSDTTVLRVPEENFETFIQSDYRNAMSIMKTMARNLALLNVNMNMMIEELKALGSGGLIDEQAILRLVESVTAPANPDVAVPETPPEEPVDEEAESVDIEKLELTGHKLFPRITHPAYEDFTFDKNYTCPHCGNKFFGKKIFQSKLVPVQSRQQHLRYDLRIFYRNFEVEWYDVVTCPRCCFSSLDRYFIKSTDLFPERFEKQLSKSRFAKSLDFSKERDLNFVFAQHYLALICAPGLPESRQLTARFWNNLHWLYRSAGAETLADLAEDKAIAAYQDVCKRCKLDPLHKQQLCMKVAGMLYEKNRLEEARTWATEAHDCLVERVGRGGYVDLAQLLLQDIREKLEEAP